MAYHDTLAADWDQRYARGGFRRRAEFFRAQILDRLPAGGDWLDVGCGSGFFSRMIAPQASSILGVDGSAEMVEVARTLAGRDNLAAKVSFQTIATVEALPLAPLTFDGVLCLSVLEYLEDPHACVAEIARVSRPGAKIALSVPYAGSWIRRALKLASAVRAQVSRGQAYLASSRWTWSRRDAAAMIEQSGLRLEHMQLFDPALPRAAWPWGGSLIYLICTKPSVSA